LHANRVLALRANTFSTEARCKPDSLSTTALTFRRGVVLGYRSSRGKPGTTCSKRRTRTKGSPHKDADWGLIAGCVIFSQYPKMEEVPLSLLATPRNSEQGRKIMTKDTRDLLGYLKHPSRRLKNGQGESVLRSTIASKLDMHANY
jgi:hypothetical protein